MKSTDEGRLVLCMKWGTLYSSDYVNVLYNAVRDNLKLSYRFICLTDDDAGIQSDVECFPLPDPLLSDAYTRPGCWPKLTIYKEDLFGLRGRALFLDLDSVICGSLAPLFEVQGELILIREWKRFADYFRKWRVNGQTSVVAFDLEGLTYLYEIYARDPFGAVNDFRNEQRFVTHHANVLTFWEHPTIISFKRHLMAPPLLDRFVPPTEPEEGVKVVVFHGVPRPIDLVPDKDQKWGKPFRYGQGAVGFVRDYWLRYGGRDPSLLDE